MYDYIDI